MKEKNRHFLIAHSTILLAGIALLSCTSNNWPQYRGPDWNMVATGRGLPAEWGETQNVRWTYEMDGESWSSPIVWGNRVFVTSVLPVQVSPPPESPAPAPPPGQQPQEDLSYLEDIYRWQVACVDLETGALLWKKVAYEGSPRTKKHAATNYGGESPVTDGKRLYVYFGMRGLYCYDLEGNLLWEKDLGAYETQNGWGTGSSPILFEDILYVQVDNEQNSFLVALDAVNGDEIWKLARQEKTNYSTPVIWDNTLRTELVVGGYKAHAYDPLTGEPFWECEMAGRYSIPSAVPDGDMLYMGNAAFNEIPGTFFAIEAGAEGDITPTENASEVNGLRWYNLDAPTGNPSPLLYKGLLYLLGSRGELSCLDPDTGEIIYQEQVSGTAACWASPWAHDGKIYFIDERGVTRVIRAGREFEFLYQNELDDKFWASVAITKDAYLLKGVERLYCIGN